MNAIALTLREPEAKPRLAECCAFTIPAVLEILQRR